MHPATVVRNGSSGGGGGSDNGITIMSLSI